MISNLSNFISRGNCFAWGVLLGNMLFRNVMLNWSFMMDWCSLILVVLMSILVVLMSILVMVTLRRVLWNWFVMSLFVLPRMLILFLVHSLQDLWLLPLFKEIILFNFVISQSFNTSGMSLFS